MQYIPGQSLDKLIAEGPASLQLVLSAGIQIADGLLPLTTSASSIATSSPPTSCSPTAASSRFSTSASPAASILEEAEFDPAAPSASAKSAPSASRPTYTARGGTIAYMAPEQFVTGQTSVQSDIFALGLILYELASGRHPFHRPDAPEFQIHPRHPVRSIRPPSAR